MKRLVVFLTIIALVVAASSICASAEETPYAYAVTTKKAVNLREDATTKSKSLTQIKKGEMVGILGEKTTGKDTWYQVTYNDLRGWIRGDLLKFTDAPMPTVAPNTGDGGLYGLTIDKLAARTGPSTTYEGGGTYNVKGQWIKVLSRAYDTRNGIWWVKCEIPYKNEIRVLWTGYKRFDSSTIPLETIPIEGEETATSVSTPIPVDDTDGQDIVETPEVLSSTEPDDSSYITYSIDGGPKLKVHYSAAENIISDPASPISFVNNEILAMAKREVSYETVLSFVSSQGGSIVGQNDYLREYQIQLPYQLDSLTSFDVVEQTFMESGLFDYCFANYYMPMSPNINDAKWSDWDGTADLHWGYDAIRAWDMWYSFDMFARPHVRVGIMDNQFYTEHEDLDFKNVFLNNFDPTLNGASHGTHVAGIIGATPSNGKGISGVSLNADMYGASIVGLEGRTGDYVASGFSESGTSVSAYHAALTYLICIKECKVINISYGIPENKLDELSVYSDYVSFVNSLNTPIAIALREFISQGLDFLIVKSAGNDRLFTNRFSKVADGGLITGIEDEDIKSRIIVVGAAERLNSSYQVCDFSSEGNRVDIIAPGRNIYSTVYSPNTDAQLFHNFSGYSMIVRQTTEGPVYWEGTSMATPFVSGVAASMWSVNSNLTGPEVKNILIRTATGSYTYEGANNYHYPMLDAYAAVEAAVNGLPSSESPQTTFQTWQEAYRRFVESTDYVSYIHCALPEFEEDCLNRNTLRDNIAFHDIDGNGIPELLVLSSYALEQIDVFTYKDGWVVWLGTLGGDNFINETFYLRDSAYPWLFVTLGGPGFEAYGGWIDGDALSIQKVGYTTLNSEGDTWTGFFDTIGDETLKGYFDQYIFDPNSSTLPLIRISWTIRESLEDVVWEDILSAAENEDELPIGNELFAEITSDTGEYHSGGEISFSVRIIGGTPPYTISYSILEESYNIDPNYTGPVDDTYGQTQDGYASIDGSVWDLRYTPSDPTMHVTLGINVIDLNGFSNDVEGQCLTVYSNIR